MKFFKVENDYYINLEDISIFYIRMMGTNYYNDYNSNRDPKLDKLQFILHVVYKSGSENGIHYALTARDKNRFMKAIKSYIV